MKWILIGGGILAILLLLFGIKKAWKQFYEGTTGVEWNE